MKSTSNKLLVTELKNGNKSAFAHVYENYSNKVYHFILKFIIDQEDARELVQQVFIKLWENKKNIDPGLPLDPYLFVISRNCCFDFLKRAARDRELKEQLLQMNSIRCNETENKILLNEYEALVNKAILQLPEKRREVFNCRLDGMSYDEIAIQLNISKNTVKTHLLKSYRFVKEYVKVFADISFSLFIFLFF